VAVPLVLDRMQMWLPDGALPRTANGNTPPTPLIVSSTSANAPALNSSMPTTEANALGTIWSGTITR